LFFGIFYFYLREGDPEKEEDDDIYVGEVYESEEFGYSIIYPREWELNEDVTLSFFHHALREDYYSQRKIDFNTYYQVSGVNFSGKSPLVYIDGEIGYNIEKRVYININLFTARQWYDVAATADARDDGKISSADFIRRTNQIIEEGDVQEDREKIFDPWMTQGHEIKVGDKNVLKVTKEGDHRYDGYQYYIFSYGRYIFVFRFGYGGPVLPREMWHRNDNHVKEIIASMELF